MVTGPTGSGKSTLIEIVHHALVDDQKKMRVMDTSACVAESRRRRTKVGKQLLKLGDAQKAGFLLPGDLVVESVMENLEWFGEGQDGIVPFHVFLAGSPRTVEEAQRWKEVFASDKKLLLRVLHVECTREEVHDGIKARKKNGVNREDDAAESLKTKWDEYQRQTLPALNLLGGDILYKTKRERPLLERVHNLVGIAAVPEHTRRNWFAKLHNSNHPIHEAIERVENGLELEGRPRVTSSLSRSYPPGSHLSIPPHWKPLVFRASP